MPRTCTVCSHSDRAAIDAALIAGGSNSGIAREYGLSEDAVRRHANSHLAPAAEDANRARERDLFAEVDRLIRRIEGALDRAEKQGDDRLLLLAVRETRATLELLAKLRGELDERPQVNILLAPEWQAMRALILAALTPYPAARLAVADAVAHASISSVSGGGQDV